MKNINSPPGKSPCELLTLLIKMTKKQLKFTKIKTKVKKVVIYLDFPARIAFVLPFIYFTYLFTK